MCVNFTQPLGYILLKSLAGLTHFQCTFLCFNYIQIGSQNKHNIFCIVEITLNGIVLNNTIPCKVISKISKMFNFFYCHPLALTIAEKMHILKKGAKNKYITSQKKKKYF